MDTAAAAPASSTAPFVPFLPFLNNGDFKPGGSAEDKTTMSAVSSDADKSEDGRTVVLGEARVDSQPVLITQTLPAESTSSQDVAACTSAPILIDTKGTSTLVNTAPIAEEDKLAPPPPQLDAPLDTMRPDPQQQADGEANNACNSTSSSQPNALAQWSSISSSLAGKSLVIFLDYDGTLTPIVSEPSKAIISPEQRARVARLAAKFPVAIVTGRKMATIKQFVLGADGQSAQGLGSLYFAGSHGFDISCPSSSKGQSDKRVAEDYLPLLQDFYRRCSSECASIAGALVEDSTFSISVHYRNCSEQDAQRVDAIVTKNLAPFAEKLVRHAGKMVYEIRPKIDWNKGKAVEYLMQLILGSAATTASAAGASSSSTAAAPSTASSSSSSRSFVPVYLGDDTTDEDAFRFLRSLSNLPAGTKPLTIFVRPDDKIRESAAHYMLKDPAEVGQLLDRLAKL